MFPGQGADYRLFDSISFKDKYKVHYMEYFTPKKGVNMNDYGRKLASQIDTTLSFVLIGTSIGGMLAVEISTFLNPEKVIVISSAKCRSELPWRYRFQKYIPLFEIFPPGVIKFGASILQPILESDVKSNRETFKEMLNSKDPKFLKRTIRMIVNWEHEECDSNIIHIHGTMDKTIPIRNVETDYEIDKGSHMITLTRAALISATLNMCLSYK